MMSDVTTNIITVNGVTGVGVTLEVPPGVHRGTVSTGGGFVSITGGLPLEPHTVTIQGTNQLLSANGDGTVTLVAPMRIDTTSAVAGRVPTVFALEFSFVPEPGTMLLLVSGAVGLLVIGHRRLRK